MASRKRSTARGMSRHGERVVQVVERRLQEAAARRRFTEPAMHQNSGGRRANLERR